MVIMVMVVFLIPITQRDTENQKEGDSHSGNDGNEQICHDVTSYLG